MGNIVMSTGAEELRAKMAQIAGRYLDRVGKEVVQLRTMIVESAGVNLDAVREIEALTHRMHGSGAMLHFDEISEHAGQMERMSAGFIASGEVEQARLLETLDKLQIAIDRAVAARSTAQP
jgi:chemotaxis protein histidine kinase CheA